MKLFFLLFLSSMGVFLLLDLIWLLVISKNLYSMNIGHLMGTVKIIPAIVFYIIFVIGIVVFVLLPSIEVNSLGRVIIMGALFGFVCYATYDLTNLATLKDWPILITFVDLIWGAFVSSTTASVVFIIGKYFQWF